MRIEQIKISSEVIEFLRHFYVSYTGDYTYFSIPVLRIAEESNIAEVVDKHPFTIPITKEDIVSTGWTHSLTPLVKLRGNQFYIDKKDGTRYILIQNDESLVIMLGVNNVISATLYQGPLPDMHFFNLLIKEIIKKDD